MVNDADAAGLAEVEFGAAKGQRGLVIVTTLGTGIGSALIHDGVLVPNSELGHLEIEGHDAESRAANSARENEELSYPVWAERLTTYYRTVERLFSPELIVVGGGVSKSFDQFGPLIDIETPIVRGAAAQQGRHHRRRPGLLASRASGATRPAGADQPVAQPVLHALLGDHERRRLIPGHLLVARPVEALAEDVVVTAGADPARVDLELGTPPEGARCSRHT